MIMKYLFVTLLAVHSIDFTKACSCLMAHQQSLYCEADFVMQVRLRGKPEDIYRKEETMVFNEDTNSVQPTIVRDKVALKYNVKIKKIFKANDNDFGFDQGSTYAALFSPPNDGLCLVDLSERVTYLISGKYFNGELHISLCGSIHTPWEWVTKYQKKGLRFTYNRNCDCKIYHEQYTEGKDTTNSCLWDPFGRLGDCFGRHTACIHDKNSTTGGCKWQRNNKLRQCKAEKKYGRQEP